MSKIEELLDKYKYAVTWYNRGLLNRRELEEKYNNVITYVEQLENKLARAIEVIDGYKDKLEGVK